MTGIYGDDPAIGDENVAEKPSWNDDIDITDIVPPETDSKKKGKKDKKKKKKKEEDMEEGVDVDEMDVDVLATEAESSKGKKRKLADEDLEELYALDFNSMVGDLPTRFKYMNVLPQAYGLTPTEILLADDNELNEYVGLRKIAAPYRKDKGRTWDANRAEKLNELRKKVGERIGKGDMALDVTTGDSKKRRKGKKERQKEKLIATATSDEQNTEHGTSHALSAIDAINDVGTNETRPSKKRKRKHKKSSDAVEAK